MPKMALRSAFRLSVFALALLVLVATQQKGRAESAYTYALVKPVKIELVNADRAGLKFSIPKAFLTRSVDRRGGERTDFIVDVAYPEMMPLSVSDPNTYGGANDTAEVPDADRRFWIRIWVHPAIRASISNYMRHRVLRHPQLESANQNEQEFALFRSSLQEDYLVPKDLVDDETIYLRCWPLPKPDDQAKLGAGCYGHVLYGDRVELEFIFQRRHVHLWKDIETRVESLVRLFMIECFDDQDSAVSSKPTSTCIP